MFIFEISLYYKVEICRKVVDTVEIRSAYYKPLRTFVSAYLFSIRQKLELTQAEMAEFLCIDVRTYIDAEHGKTLCSTCVLLLFTNLLRNTDELKEDYTRFVEGLYEVMAKVEANLDQLPV